MVTGFPSNTPSTGVGIAPYLLSFCFGVGELEGGVLKEI